MKTLSLVLMALLYIVAGINHFRDPNFYLRLMPDFLPAHLALIYWSGLAEIVLGVLLVPPSTRSYAAWTIIAMLCVFMLIHVPMALYPEHFPGFSPLLLWIRIPIQGVLILWALTHTRRL
ncbi:MAG: DoxX family protein [Candidatus Hydrogenedens sp.]|nr:DoxX family protein [Candidatus Hydrogenedens sp.]